MSQIVGSSPYQPKKTTKLNIAQLIGIHHCWEILCEPRVCSETQFVDRASFGFRGGILIEQTLAANLWAALFFLAKKGRVTSPNLENQVQNYTPFDQARVTPMPTEIFPSFNKVAAIFQWGK